MRKFNYSNFFFFFASLKQSKAIMKQENDRKCWCQRHLYMWCVCVCVNKIWSLYFFRGNKNFISQIVIIYQHTHTHSICKKNRGKFLFFNVHLMSFHFDFVSFVFVFLLHIWNKFRIRFTFFFRLSLFLQHCLVFLFGSWLIIVFHLKIMSLANR